MTLDIADLRTELKQAIAQIDRVRAQQLSDELVRAIYSGQAVSAADAKDVLGLLRRKRFFAMIGSVCEALIQTRQASPNTRRQYCQALIDTGRIAAAIGLLEALVADTATSRDDGENAEARGLLGRSHKQIYVIGAGNTDRARATLREAVEFYHSVYLQEPARHYWHGINAVACLCRAERDGLQLRGFPDPRAIARDVRAAIEGRDNPDTWSLATAMEASLALGQHDKALEWMVRYVESDYADAFELTSTRRQLIEVWQLDGTSDPGDKLLHVLNAKLLKQEDGSVELRPGDVYQQSPLHDPQQRDDFERTFGCDSYQAMEWIDEGRRLCQAIARISQEHGDSAGTGFLVRGGDLRLDLGDEPVLLTNSHVISADETVHDRLNNPPLYPDEVSICFGDREGQGRKHKVKEILWTSPPWEFDGTLVRLDQPPTSAVRCTLHPRLPRPGGQNRVYIIGHPKGGPLSWSLHDNYLLDHEDPKLHYRTPTDPGSSGSPVFNANWKLIGLHHAGNEKMKRLNKKAGTYEANEGIWIQSIKKAITDAP